MAREEFKAVIYYVTLIVILLSLVAFIVFGPKPEGRMYNCTLAEISPDFPPEVRDQCRKLRLEQYKNDSSR